MEFQTLLNLYIIFQAFLWLFDQTLLEFSHKKKDVIILRDEPNVGHNLNLLQWAFKWIEISIVNLMEYAILSRYSICGYKNNVRSNLRIVSAISLTLFMSLCISAICHQLGSPIELVKAGKLSIVDSSILIAITGFCVSAFIIERGHLHKKWEMLAEQKIKVLETEPSLKRNILEAEFNLNLIEMEMWAHNSYRKDFSSFLKIALYNLKKSRSEVPVASTCFEIHQIDKKEALDICRKYQRILIDHQKYENKVNDFLKSA
ncbi:hypothetical protein CIK05_10595 [Bdellovibrio sp. qaytius]|nr:hypothetical protein CIK05_10595 [Bdellovibrio sp. qaytius]